MSRAPTLVRRRPAVRPRLLDGRNPPVTARDGFVAALQALVVYPLLTVSADPYTSFTVSGAYLLRTAVVLAAGNSQRLRTVTGGGSKLLLRMGGLPLIERTVRTATRIGMGRIVVVVGHDADRIAQTAEQAGSGRVVVVRAPDWELGNGCSLAAAAAVVGEESMFLVLTGDHILDEAALRALLAAGGPAALVDPDPDPTVLAEGTRAVLAGGRIIAFGKSRESGLVDCGAFCAPATLFACQVEAAAEGDYGLAGALTRLAGRVSVQAVPMPEGSYWQDVDTPADVAHAQAMLRRSLSKPADGPVSRWLNRPLSTRLTMLLAPFRPSPNLVTWLVCGLGLLAAGLLAAGQGVAGGFLAQATSVVDGVDGELARLQLRASPRGALLDGVLDRLADAAILAGLGVWALSAGLPATLTVALVAAAVTAALLSMATKDRIAALGLPPGPEHRLGYLLCGRDGRLLLVAVFAVLGKPEAALVAVALTSGLGAMLRVWGVWHAPYSDDPGGRRGPERDPTGARAGTPPKA
jgi:1L-myo-inositol 1-phosphate cytidylyltransferase / CDP-L-myo-inositol myo-inositolphosphotransferase